MMKRFFLFVYVFFCCSLTLFSQNVTNVEVFQEGKQAVITYTLDETADITVQVSTDGGQTFSVLLTKVTGDVGSSVSAGNKRIVWDVLAERDRLVGDNIVFQVNANGNIHNGHEYVDLGLPSGLLWATCNVGANKPEEYGDYFAWGETTAKSIYRESNYTYKNNPTTLPLSADAAHVNWGGNWRMPTRAEQDELLNNCTWTWTSRNEKNGYEVKGKNGKSIFLSATGDWRGKEVYNVGSCGRYWASSLNAHYSDNSTVWDIRFCWDSKSRSLNMRYFGQSIRPVCSLK